MEKVLSPLPNLPPNPPKNISAAIFRWSGAKHQKDASPVVPGDQAPYHPHPPCPFPTAKGNFPNIINMNIIKKRDIRYCG